MYNYHTHTSRCKHAYGTDEQYVKQAILANYKGLGFSDHVMLPNIENGVIRGDFNQKDDYINSIRSLQKQYEGIIEIYLGFECEWDKRYQKYYENLLKEKEVDYLIFANHGLYFKNNQERFLKISSSKQFLQRYLKYSVKALNSGLFKIMAHPDIFMSSVAWNKDCEKVANIICKEAKKNNVALEINLGCFINEEKKDMFNENRYRYPYDKFWKIAKKHGNTIVIGVDAHNPLALSSEKKELAKQFINKLKLTITEKLDIYNMKGDKYAK